MAPIPYRLPYHFMTPYHNGKYKSFHHANRKGPYFYFLRLSNQNNYLSNIAYYRAPTALRTDGSSIKGEKEKNSEGRADAYKSNNDKTFEISARSRVKDTLDDSQPGYYTEISKSLYCTAFDLNSYGIIGNIINGFVYISSRLDTRRK